MFARYSAEQKQNEIPVMTHDRLCMTRLAPNPALAQYIECYWMLDASSLNTFYTGAVDMQRMPADARIELIFNFAAGSRRQTADGKDVCNVDSVSFVMGARSRGYTVDHAGIPRYAAVRFMPGGLSAFVRLPPGDTTDIYVELKDLWSAREVQHIEMQLADATTPEAQAAILDAALLAHLNPPEHLDRLMYAAGRARPRGSADASAGLAKLAEEVNLSQKHFERLFVRYVGFRPSLYVRVARFQRALYLAVSRSVVDRQVVDGLSQLALAAGYYDQSHFSRDFKLFSGCTPQQFFAQSHQFVQIAAPISQAHQQVDSVQDPSR